MQPGKLDREIVIQSYTTSLTGAGQPLKSWSPLATVWANVTNKQDDYDKESFPGDQKTPMERTFFKIRYRADVTESHRISYDGKFYDIIAIKELGRKDGLMLKTIRRYHT